MKKLKYIDITHRIKYGHYYWEYFEENSHVIQYFDTYSELMRSVPGACVHSYLEIAEYWYNGQRHRLEGPARICKDGGKEYYLFGAGHRYDGPAIDNMYILHSQQIYDKKEYDEIIKSKDPVDIALNVLWYAKENEVENDFKFVMQHIISTFKFMEFSQEIIDLINCFSL